MVYNSCKNNTVLKSLDNTTLMYMLLRATPFVPGALTCVIQETVKHGFSSPLLPC